MNTSECSEVSILEPISRWYLELSKVLTRPDQPLRTLLPLLYITLTSVMS